MADHDDHESVDDKSMCLQLQSFLDEWHYRVLHSGLATEFDRTECAVAAMRLFELCGLSISDEEKQSLAQLEESEMVNRIVQHMSVDVRRAWEHMALQLQLVMSAASRVRCTLDDGTPEDLARMMDEGDAGVNQQILKRTILQAGSEVSEMRQIHESWEGNMKSRLSRMTRAQQDCDAARSELNKINDELASFGADQNAKSKKVLLSMAGNNDKVLVLNVFQGWRQWFHKYKMEKDIHDKFQAEIDNAKAKLFSYKQARVANIRNVMMRSSADAANLIMKECFIGMAKAVQDAKEEAALQENVKAASERMANMKAAQKDNAKKSMARMCAGNDESLKSMVFSEWTKAIAQLKQDKEYEGAVKAQEERFAQFMKEKSEQAKGVLARMSGSSDTGLMHNAWKAWVEDYQAEKKAKEMEELLNGENAKFKSLNARMKENASGKAGRSIDIENDNLLMAVFMNWQLEARVQRVVTHYSGQLDSKKHQLEAVQTMFQSFASQLEKGIESTPRKKDKSSKSSNASGERKASAAVA